MNDGTKSGMKVGDHLQNFWTDDVAIILHIKEEKIRDRDNRVYTILVDGYACSNSYEECQINPNWRRMWLVEYIWYRIQKLFKKD